ncbi:helix-turn-helix domain-containing protein [Patescibacteria group bacterium]|nr:helix-turn-helix domain-containing protein [Patescibacteria group bacterium]
MATNWSHLLKALGLSESEAAIYLAALECGPSSVQDLAKKAHVSRVTTYAVIETLSARGLMSSVEKGKKHLFAAESPERLVSRMQTRVKEMEATLHEVQDAIHELKLMQRGEKPVVRMFEGDEAMKAIYEDLAATRPTHIDELGNLDELRKFVTIDHVTKQLEAGLKKAKRRCLYITKETRENSQQDGEARRFLSDKEYHAHGDVLIYDKKIAVSSYRGKMISVLIESQEIADTLRALFHLAWEKGV